MADKPEAKLMFREGCGDCGERQVEGAETCFVTGYGGAPHTYPVTLSYSTLILRR